MATPKYVIITARRIYECSTLESVIAKRKEVGGRVYEYKPNLSKPEPKPTKLDYDNDLIDGLTEGE